jgi:hypothetical protein
VPGVDLPAEPLELDQQLELLVAVALHDRRNELDERPEQLHPGGQGRRRRLDQNAAAIGRVRNSPRVAGAFEAIDHTRDRARRQAARPRELAGAHLPDVLEQIQAATVGVVDAHKLVGEVVDDRRRSLSCSHLVAQLPEQLGSPIRRIA